jgi:hypothetical protein
MNKNFKLINPLPYPIEKFKFANPPDQPDQWKSKLSESLGKMIKSSTSGLIFLPSPDQLNFANQQKLLTWMLNFPKIKIWKFKVGRFGLEHFQREMDFILDLVQRSQNQWKVRLDFNAETLNLSDINYHTDFNWEPYQHSIEYIEDPFKIDPKSKIHQNLNFAQTLPPVALDEGLRILWDQNHDIPEDREMMMTILSQCKITLIVKPTWFKDGFLGASEVISLAQKFNLKVIISSAFEDPVELLKLDDWIQNQTYLSSFTHGLGTFLYYSELI